LSQVGYPLLVEWLVGGRGPRPGMPWDERAPGASGNPLSGVFGGRPGGQGIFGTALGLPRAGARVSIAPWTPWADAESAEAGPVEA
jgi:hypothetical protein